MIKAAVILIAFGLLIVCPAVGQSGQQDVSPCPPSPQNYPDNMVRPKYPKNALRNGTEGTIDLRATVAPDGKIKDLQVFDGDAVFSQAAEAAIRKWRFHPEVRKGHAVESVYKIQVRFNVLLQEANSDVELESPLPDKPWASDSGAVTSTPEGPVYRVSKDPVITGPKATYAPEPEFSEEARKGKQQGNVQIGLIVGTDGLPRNLHLLCTDWPSLNEKALEAVRRWRFQPGTKDGKPVQIEIEIEVEFHLND
jgi:TonB family protein